ncbi:hypothetical protein QQ045_006207 [Rhodiola kirilowii]
MSYQGHRRWLHREHPWRYADSKFNGEVELQDAPPSLIGEEVFSSTISHEYPILSLHRDLKPRGGNKEKLCCTHDRDQKMKTQNSGVLVEDGHVTSYGVIWIIIQLQFANGMPVVLFDCLWFNTDLTDSESTKQDYGLLSVDTSTCWYEDWPYCLATTARQVFYLDDLKAGDSWKVVNVVAHRGTYSQRSLARHDESSNSDTHTALRQTLISPQEDDPYQEDMPLHISNDLQPMDPNVDEIPRARRRLNLDEDDDEARIEHEDDDDDELGAQDNDEDDDETRMEHEDDQWKNESMEVEDDQWNTIIEQEDDEGYDHQLDTSDDEM